ncbi:MAG: hypothetical protein KKA73_19635 [Chloroflexi bacterium]|nr:hypothetical protein [Chloroflexota bacterium]MBU1749900.1 hypothetical protein [Chloroflexota bacterium]MBU1877921.1 hypothetical protein [Chloroflexota bacterium]
MQEEQRRILEMLEARTISAEEAASLMAAMSDESPVVEDATIVPVTPAPDEPDREWAPAEEIIIIEEKSGRPIEEFTSPWMLPFGLGLGLLMLGIGVLWVMSYLGQMNFFWFLCGLIPLGWAVVFVLAAAWLAWGLWLHVRVESADGSRIRLHIPLPPFGLATWALRLAGRFVPYLRTSALDETLETLQKDWKRGERMVVQVDDEGDKVEVVIG